MFGIESVVSFLSPRILSFVKDRKLNTKEFFVEAMQSGAVSLSCWRLVFVIERVVALTV